MIGLRCRLGIYVVCVSKSVCHLVEIWLLGIYFSTTIAVICSSFLFVVGKTNTPWLYKVLNPFPNNFDGRLFPIQSRLENCIKSYGHSLYWCWVMDWMLSCTYDKNIYIRHTQLYTKHYQHIANLLNEEIRGRFGKITRWFIHQ